MRERKLGRHSPLEAVRSVVGKIEQRRSERVHLTIPILVAGLDEGSFSEETRTVVVNRDGARIILRQPVRAEDTVRIFNLENNSEADFRIVGPTSFSTDQGIEWGVECLKEGVNIWGVDFPPPPGGADAFALLECLKCHKKFFWPLTSMEIEVLQTTGVIHNFCDSCGEQTSWAFEDVNLRPKAPPGSALAAARPQEERRSGKRSVAKVPILVRDRKGKVEVTKTENMSKGDFAAVLAMDLAPGDIVTVVCPYTASGKNVERKGKVLRRESAPISGRRFYAFCYTA